MAHKGGIDMVENKIVMEANLYRISKDREGEVKITFTVSKLEAPNAMKIPEEAALILAVVVK